MAMANDTDRLSLAAGVLPEFRGPAVAQAAAASGFRAFGVTVDEAWTTADTRAIARLQRAEGLRCLDVEVLWLAAGAEITDHHFKLLDVGAELQAAQILMVSDEPDTGRVAAAQHALCERAAAGGQGVVLEFLRITAISRPSQALAIALAADHKRAGVLVDTLHLARSGESIDVLRESTDRLPYLQLCDGPATCAEDPAALLKDALDDRCAPGEGALPLTATVELLPNAPLSLEVRSASYRSRYPDPAERARALRSATLRFFDQQQRSIPQ